MIDLIILSNGPGEVTTWVYPVVQQIEQQLAEDRANYRVSVILAPCPHAMGNEATIVKGFSGVDRVQSSEHFWSFLLLGKTVDNWEWAERGVVVFLGGDQFFPVIIGKRLGYSILIYGETDVRWGKWVDRFAVMNQKVIDKLSPQYHAKCTIVGDLMADITNPNSLKTQTTSRLGILVGSKPAKLYQGVPLMLAIAQDLALKKPGINYIIPLAPTLTPETLAQYANPDFNPFTATFGNITATLHYDDDYHPYLRTNQGLIVSIITQFPCYEELAQCTACLTTVGANTAQLGALTIPMIVLLPTQQIDAMKSWDGLLGIIVNFPIVGKFLIKIINKIIIDRIIKTKKLLSWPNIWAGKEIVPELIGELTPQQGSEILLNWLNNPQKLQKVKDDLKQVRGNSGASIKIVQLIRNILEKD